MKDILIHNYRFNLQYAEALVVDVDEEMMTLSGGAGLENHPAFTIGHLVTAAAMTSKYLNGPYEINKSWEDIFKRKGPGDPRRPEADSSLYPKKAALLTEFSRQHGIVEGLIQAMDENEMKKLVKWRYHDRLPTLGDLLYFMCITHEAMHLGQLAGWRRAMNLPSALAAL